MKSIDMLREYANVRWEPWASSQVHIMGLLDDVEAEVAYRYMELPVDADGVPVHIGDLMTYADGSKPKEVIAVTSTDVYLCDDGPRYAGLCRHYQPDTWERIIEDAMGNRTQDPRELVARCKALAGDAS